jgi:sugar/nucleoside kinase (ribokinase family)
MSKDSLASCAANHSSAWSKNRFIDGRASILCMINTYDVFGIGNALVDYFVKSDEDFLLENGLIKGASNFLPREKLDELHSKVSDSIFTCLPGDNARNVCEGVSFLGGRAAYASSTAEDEAGKIFESSLRTQHIDSFLEKRQGDTGKILVFITPDYERTFAVDLGNSRDYDALPSEGIKNSNFLYITSIIFLTNGRIAKSVGDAIEFAIRNNVHVSISLESPPMINKSKDELYKIIHSADILFANEEELEALVGSRDDEAALDLAEEIGMVCLKRGIRGSTIFSCGERFSIPCYSVKVVDTTGAGDFYAAGVLFGLSKGKSIEEAGHLGAKLAGKVVERFGATLY